MRGLLEAGPRRQREDEGRERGVARAGDVEDLPGGGRDRLDDAACGAQEHPVLPQRDDDVLCRVALVEPGADRGRGERGAGRRLDPGELERLALVRRDQVESAKGQLVPGLGVERGEFSGVAGHLGNPRD